MFERYSESARRVIFFARYEAANTGASSIEPIHLLSGLMREDPPLFRSLLGERSILELRQELKIPLDPPEESEATSVDLPLSRESKHALHRAMTEAEQLDQHTIGCAHLLAALLHSSAPWLQTAAQYGITLERAREVVAGSREQPDDSWLPPKTQAAIGMARAGSQHSTYRFENEEMVVETDRAYFGHHILITERIRMSDDRKKLMYRQRITGPGGKITHFEEEFDLTD
jgi:ATP-dependent Clp protease ATP-binding subunit ClpC